jgi:hypothetical protein
MSYNWATLPINLSPKNEVHRKQVETAIQEAETDLSLLYSLYEDLWPDSDLIRREKEEKGDKMKKR